MDSSQTTKNGKLGRFFWALALIACALVAARYFCAARTADVGGDAIDVGPVAVVPPPPAAEAVETVRQQRQLERRRRLEEERLQIEAAKLRADIERRCAQFRGDVNALGEKYRKMLPLSAAADGFKAAREGADFIASREGLCGFKVCVALAYKMAYDKIKETNRTREAIEPIVTSRVADPLRRAVQVYADWTSEFRGALQKEEQAFALDIAARSHAFKERIEVLTLVDARKLDDAAGKLVADVRNHAQSAVFASVGVAVEMAMIQSSYATVRGIVSKFLATTVAKKIGATVGASAVAAASDGPLPFGDCVAAAITVGGLALTAYDIYDVTKKMPAEMKRGVMTAIDDAEKALTKTAAANLAADCEACLKSAEARVRDLCRVLGKKQR